MSVCWSWDWRVGRSIFEGGVWCVEGEVVGGVVRVKLLGDEEGKERIERQREWGSSGANKSEWKGEREKKSSSSNA